MIGKVLNNLYKSHHSSRNGSASDRNEVEDDHSESSKLPDGSKRLKVKCLFRNLRHLCNT